MMNRRTFLRGLGATVLSLGLLPPIKVRPTRPMPWDPTPTPTPVPTVTPTPTPVVPQPYRGAPLLRAGQYEQFACSWWYNYTPTITNVNNAVAMIKRPDDLGKSVATEWLLLYNEPGIDVPEIRLPLDCAILCKQAEEMYPDRRLVSPALYLRECMGPQWIPSPFTLSQVCYYYGQLYGGRPKWEAVALHMYSFVGNLYDDPTHCVDTVEANLVGLQHAIDEAHALGYDDVWVTECGFMPWDWSGWDLSTVQRVMARQAEWLESNPSVKRWSWFPSNGYVQGDARWSDVALTVPELGAQYAALQQWR